MSMLTLRLLLAFAAPFLRFFDAFLRHFLSFFRPDIAITFFRAMRHCIIDAYRRCYDTPLPPLVDFIVATSELLRRHA